MKHGYKLLRGLVFTNPLGLNTIKDAKLIKIAESYLPFDTGIEVECNYKTSIRYSSDLEQFAKEQISYLKRCSHDSSEQRYRIPNGINGMIALYHISQFLKKYSQLNMDSGIHYHIDFTKYFDTYHNEIIAKNSEWILKELDCWNYIGTYNRRSISSSKCHWLRICSTYKTIEFRIGEMTFDYDILIKRITHAQHIVSKLIAILTSPKKDETVVVNKKQQVLGRYDPIRTQQIFTGTYAITTSATTISYMA